MAGAVDALGALLAVGGSAWAAWAAWLLRAAGTPVLGRAVPTVLVEEGPYRFGRHPIYLGALAALCGIALATGQGLVALAALLLAIVVAARLVPREEAALQRRFGGWWHDYAGSVRRWL